MSVTSSVHSNALNFMSFIQGGVDPRTGQYSLKIELPELGGNDLLGPEFRPTLHYSPLNVIDSGLGMGWTLQLSQYTPHNQVLSLSTGESLKITDRTARPMRLEEQRIDNFHVYPEGNDGLRVVHRSGLVEILTEQGTGQASIYLPVAHYSPLGHRLVFNYQRFSSQHPLLESIQDGDGRMLLRVLRDPTGYKVELQLQPFSGSDGEALATYVMNLVGDDRRVKEIVIPSDDQARWTFDYRKVLAHLCLTSVTQPTGATEHLSYLDGGHQFPTGSGRQPLPRVTHHVIEPHFDQPAAEIHYRYPGPRNFLGGGSDMSWSDDGRDNLYQRLDDYDYSSVEILMETGREVRRIERTYNRFHLLTHETTLQGDCLQRLITAYGMVEGVSFKNQPPTCQLPVSEERFWQMTSGERPWRSEQTVTEYDNHGNVLSHTYADGTVQSNEWYSAAEQDGHPADPEGFVRHLKAQTLRPSPNGQPGAATLTRTYRYTTLPGLAVSGTSAVVQFPHHVVSSETLIDQASAQRPLAHVRNQWVNAPHDQALHGRQYLKVENLQGLETVTEYTYSLDRSAGTDEPVLNVQQLRVGYDGTQAITTVQYALRHGQVMQERDSDGVETRYRYDRLQRVVQETVAPGLPTEASRLYQYTLKPISGESASQTFTDEHGVRTKTLLDGLGRVRGEERDHVNEAMAPRFYPTLAVTYDNQGRPVTETHIDWLEGLRSLNLPQHYAYDDWGQRCCTTGPDGVQQHEHQDPLGNAQHRGLIVHRWRQAGTGPTAMISSRSQTWMNRFEKPDLILRQDAEGLTLGTRRFAYDGLGRLVSETDERRHTTTFTYDIFDRPLQRILPDSTCVETGYAQHSTAQLPISLTVRPGNIRLPAVQVGAQSFDGLDRLQGTTTGWRSERYHYEGSESRARRKRNAAGQSIDYAYDLSLTTYPITSSSAEENAVFDYDPIGARLTRASGAHGRCDYRYNVHGHLLEEHLQVSGHAPLKTEHHPSLQGRPQRTVEASGLETFYHFHDNGLPRLMQQHKLDVNLEYDSLARLEKITSTDLDNGARVVTVIEFDDQDREVKRSWQQSGHPERIQTQLWDFDGLLKERHLCQGAVTLLKETFTYTALGQLLTHHCAGIELPHDSQGRAIMQQTFSYTHYESLDMVTSQFADGSPRERARYVYADDDPCQLRSITYNPARRQSQPIFKYDRNGNMVLDQHSRTLRYDSQNRLKSLVHAAGTGQYRYDAHDRLLGTNDGNGADSVLVYQNHRLCLAVRGALRTQYLDLEDQPIGQQTLDDASQTVLLHTADNASVVAESQHDSLRSMRYSAYGERYSDTPVSSAMGFNGEALDPLSGRYLLGSGYRAYDPELRCFLSPDSLSPFGGGGLNCYAYARGNPIAFRDPTGHEAIGFSGRLRRPDEDITPQSEPEEVKQKSGGGWLKWLWVGIAVVMTVVAVVTFGKAAVAAVAAWKGAAAALAATAAVSVTKTAAALAIGKAVAAGVSAALAVAGTAAQVHGTITDNETSFEVAQWLGVASFVVGVASAGAFYAAGRMMRGATGSVTTGSRAASLADDVAPVSARSDNWQFSPPYERGQLLPRYTSLVPPPRAMDFGRQIYAEGSGLLTLSMRPFGRAGALS
ncbi:RHS repeat-associated core domain-containing protein [Pseudomonas putida]|uniref:RHS repeat-associated core domain-containing protein n=1 Tax=Pseudomonas putida TaxID=303 RepID=UPI00357115BC